MNHELKIWSEYYKDIISKIKRFEIRKNDRNFQVGDQLILREFEPCKECNGGGKVVTSITTGNEEITECDCKKPHGKYTGNGCVTSVDYVLNGGQFGIEKDYCVMSITVVSSRKTYK